VCVRAPRGHRRNASRAGPSREQSIVRILIFRTILDYHSASLRSVNNCGWRYWKSTVTDVIAPPPYRSGVGGTHPVRCDRADAGLSLSLSLSRMRARASLAFFFLLFPFVPVSLSFSSSRFLTVPSIRLRYRARSFRDAEVRGALQGVHVNSLYGPDIHPTPPPSLSPSFASRLSSVTP